MNPILRKMTPTVTNLIRADHSHVLATFHQYEVFTSPGTKRALVNTVSLALELHSQLEEEIFYPALRAAGVDGARATEILDRSAGEHARMRSLIARLRAMDAADPAFDDAFMALMGDVMHHVADEETVLLPQAERSLDARLEELAAAMTKRRVELAAPRARAIVWNTARSVPASRALMGAGAVAVAGLVVAGAMSGRRRWRARTRS